MTIKQLQKERAKLWLTLEDRLNPPELAVISELIEVEIELEALSNQ